MLKHISLYLKLKRESVFNRTLYGLIFLAAGMFLMLCTFPYGRVISWEVSTVVTDRKGVPLQGTLSSSEEWSLPVAFEDMGVWMPKAVVALEDRRFYTHCGVDLAAIVRAAFQNSRSAKRISGGSTITSQVIRLAIPRERTFANKAIEFWQALQLEFFLTKRGILELYLNRATFGGNIRGVEAAARSWFGKPAKELSLAEAALLAGILRGPSYYRPDRYPKRALILRDRLLDTLSETGAASADEVRRAKLEPLPKYRTAIPSYHRMAALQVIKQIGAGAESDRFGRLRSSIDSDIQNLLKRELGKALENMPYGVTGAAVLVENSNGAVRGYIGNAREGTEAMASWVDCADSPRSPGSVLKPFIYALAFESGRLTPSSLTADSPDEMNGAAPRNFDRHYRGPVSVRIALADSLNIPAVRVLHSEGGRRTIDLYRRLGFSHFTKDYEWYGDSLALGGCEVTPLELAAAYRTLANGGRKSPLKWAEDAKDAPEEKVMTAGASALVLDILKDTRRLLPLYREIFKDEGSVIAFKTGTSYGLRDAWTAAVTKKYTLAVWFGDPSGKPHKNLVGLAAAAPVAVRIMRRVTPNGEKWFDLPPEVKKRKVCRLSGAPVNQYCPHSTEGLYIDKVSDTEPCSLHIQEDGSTKVVWPKELRGFFAKDETVLNIKNPVITSPRSAALYDLDKNRDKLPLTVDGLSGTVYWFVDGKLEAVSENGEAVFWKMTEGTHKVSVTDEDGNGAETEFKVIREREETEESLPLLEEAD